MTLFPSSENPRVPHRVSRVPHQQTQVPHPLQPYLQPYREGWDPESRLHLFILPLAAFLAVLPSSSTALPAATTSTSTSSTGWRPPASSPMATCTPPGPLPLPGMPGNPASSSILLFPGPSELSLASLCPEHGPPIVYTWLALTAAGLALYRLAREFATPAAALLSATFYLVNPYTLFTAYERTAYAELLAAAWIPLLLLAILRKKVTIPRIAIPVALLWLTDAPAAVMGCYALALLTLIRLLLPTSNIDRSDENPGAPSSPRFLRLRRVPREGATAPAHLSSTSRLQLAATTTAGTLLGLGLAAFYILPAAYERRYVQIAMAILPEMRIQDNFLFHHGADPLHDAVLHTASTIAILLLILTAITLAVAVVRPLLPGTKPRVPHPSQHYREGWEPQPFPSPPFPLTILTIAIAFLLTPLSTPVWNHLPELAFLQFPWRLLAILAAVLGLALALVLSSLKIRPALTAALSLALAATLALHTYNLRQQSCDDEDTVSARLALFHSSAGAEPTDEYTPVTADNDALSKTNPPYWLIPANSSDINQSAPANSTPGPAPTNLTLSNSTPKILVLNLRDYPAWRITLNHLPLERDERDERNDGLLAIPLPAGLNHIDITWTRTPDQTLGDILTLLSLPVLVLTLRRKRARKS